MLDVLEYGIDRVTDPNENKVNQVRQVFVSYLLNLFGRTQTTSLGLWVFGHCRLSESAQGDSQTGQKLKPSHCPGGGALKIGFGSIFWLENALSAFLPHQ